LLEVVNLQCTRGDRRLFSGIAFELLPGELLHLHGHNGSGKTTLMRALCGLVTPTEGEVRWAGRPIRQQRDEFHAELLYLGHKNGIKEDLTGIENLRTACRLAGNPISESHAWEVLERMGLRGHEDLPSRVLSQGQQKRVALSRLLVSRAKLWLLDEPFVGLDAAAVELLQQVIRDHVAREGLVVLTTHQEVALTSGRVKRLKLGWKKDGHV
jgi:heme exporter protein A